MRRAWMDNLKWWTIFCVVLFHVSCMFNSCSMPLGVGAGIPALDAVGYFTYPWIMPLMFLLAGMGARYALEQRTAGEFRRERARRLLLPLLFTILFIAPALCAFTWWMTGVSFADMSAFIPAPMVCLIGLLAGMGPQWFLPALYLFSLLLLLLRRVDGKGNFLALCAKTGWGGFGLTAVLFWLGTLILPGPDRYAAYFLSFLMGYWIFSSEGVLSRLKQGRLPLLAAAGIAFFLALIRNWGVSFAAPEFLADPVTALFGWCACLAALGGAQAWGDRPHPFGTQRGFSVYLFHYLPMLMTAYFTSRWGMPPGFKYALTLAAALGIPLILHKIFIRIPFLRRGFGLNG